MDLRTFESHSLGHVFEDSQITAFFGNKHASYDQVALFFPDYKFVFLKQTHSDKAVVSRAPSENPAPNAPAGSVVQEAEVVEDAYPKNASATSENLRIEADAHITTDRHLAIAIRTADCVPILIHEPDSGWIGSIHAGWRGVENEIILRTGELLGKQGVNLKSARAFIGPHIGVNSFEVGDDVAEKLLAKFDAVRNFSDVASVMHPHEQLGKKRIDIVSIVRAQLGRIGIDRERTRELAIDTMTSPDHESYRRDKTTGGRQISFIALK